MIWRTARVENAKAVMAKYQGRHWSMAPHEEAEYEAAWKDLKEAQKACSHAWDDVNVFTSVVKRCRWCDISRDEYDRRD
jgi:hypothetical protein